ncbi:unnamed protein product [Auanema sp. JU1783]|nr:unnamed protein product [Auanema sp. JU1783]
MYRIGNLLLSSSFNLSRVCCFSSNVPRIAVVGSGPAGLFTCASILRRSSCKLDVFDASPVPFGLVRYGVAPDHQEVKNCIHGFDKMFENNSERISLFCNVRIGNDVSFEELTRNYDGVLLAYGAHKPRNLKIPGEYSTNVFSGSDFVSWYSGVPHAAGPLLDNPHAIIVGNGNVALDCARILSAGAGPNSTLRSTDVPSEYIQKLEDSALRNIKIIGRRGPRDVSFTVKELREQFKVKGWNTSVEMSASAHEQLKIDIASFDRRKKRLLQVLVDGVRQPEGEKQCQFLFNRSPIEIIADSNNRITSVVFKNSLTNEKEEMPCGLLVYSIGFETVVLDGVPKNEKGMIDMKDECRVRTKDDSKVYAAGWCAHGPRGVIVDTQQQSSAVANEIMKDIDGNSGKSGINRLLEDRSVPYISWNKWKEMDVEEQCKGKERGKVREKITEFEKYIKKH